MSNNQSWEAWKGLDTEPSKALALKSGSVALAAELPMDENHPHFEDWKIHVEDQPHMGVD